jgi:hypothetical protein
VSLKQTPGIGNIIAKKPPVTTDLSDAVTAVQFLDDFDPDEFKPLTWQQRGPNNGFLLDPGLFYIKAKSYCLHSGKYGPKGGDGYLYAPLKGPKSNIIKNMLQMSLVYTEIPQRDVQRLLWAIQTGTKFSELPPELQSTAEKLFNNKEISRLNRESLQLVPDEVFYMFVGSLNLPPHILQIIQIEAQMRYMLARSYTSYKELERLAVLTLSLTQLDAKKCSNSL